MRYILFALTCMAVLFPWEAKACTPMSFKGKVVLAPLIDGRNMKIERSFSFFDSACREWRAPRGHIINGTSIPQLLWSLTGRTPYVGEHRIASIIHDVYYDLKTRPAHATHYAFYEALLASDVGKWEALIMYLAVTAYTPRWLINMTFECPPTSKCSNGIKRHFHELIVTPKIDMRRLKAAVKKVRNQNLSPEQVRKLGDELFFSANNYKQEGTLKIETIDHTIRINRNADIDMPVEYLLRRQLTNSKNAVKQLRRKQ